MTPSSEDPAKLDVQNPWPGLAAYEEASSAFFYGRAEEAAELLRLARLAPLTVVYGKSGLGKTSLLQAGLFPLMRAAHYLPIRLRLDFTEGVKEAPLQQVLRRLEEEFARAKVEHSEPESGEGLWEYLHRKDLEVWSEDNFPLTPVLVFDQFEELFSRSGGNVELIGKVFDALADLIENRIPAEFAGVAAGPRRSRLDLLNQRYRIILSFREDFLPEVKTWERKVPSLLRNYLRLDPMSRQRAIDAVENAGQSVLAPGVAPCIVDFVGKIDQAAAGTTDPADMVVEPVLLSLCCYQLNRRRAPETLIDTALVLEAGQDILDSFYREALDDPEVKGPPDVALFIEDYLIQGDHFRGDYPVKEALDQHRLTGTQLAALTDRHRLLRIVHHTDTTRVELIHDRIVPVVRQARDARRIRQHQEEQERLATDAEAKLQDELARSAALKEQRDAANRSLKIAKRNRNLAALASLASVIFALWGWQQVRQKVQVKRSMTLAVDTSRLADGRLAFKVGMEPLEQTMYRALAAYRLSNQVPEVRAASLIALHSVLEASGHLRKALTISDFVPTPAVSYSPDGRILAMGGEDGLIRLLDTRNDAYAEMGRLDCGQRSESVWSLAFSDDGTRLVAGYIHVGATGSGLVCVFDVVKQKKVQKWSTRELSGKPADILSVAYGGKPGTDSDFVVSGGSDHMMNVLYVKTGERHELPHPGQVVAVAVSPDGLTIASGSEDAIIRLWKVADLGKQPAREPFPLPGHEQMIEQIIFSPENSSVMVSGGDDGRIIVWKVQSGSGCLVRKSKQQPAKILSVAVNPAMVIAAAGADGDVRLFRLPETDVACLSQTAGASTVPELDVLPDGVLTGHGGHVRAVAFSAAGDRLASAGEDGSIRFWGPKTDGFSLAQLLLGSEETLAVLPAGNVTSVAISPDGKFIAAGDDKGNLQLWDQPKNSTEPAMQSATGHWSADATAIRSLAFIRTGNGLALVSGGDEGVLRRWDTVSRHEIGKDMADDHAGPIQSIAVSPDGKMFAAGHRDGMVRLWDATTGAPLRRVEKPTYISNEYVLDEVVFSRDGKHLAIAGFDRNLRVVDLDTPRSERKLKGHTGVVRAVSRGYAERWLSAAEDGSVLEWQEKAPVYTFRRGFRDRKRLTSMDTSDGRLILTGGEGGQVQLWDGVDRVLIGDHFPGHENRDIQAVAMAPDGSFFVTADASKILLWPGPDQWADIICSKLVWNMSPAQWRSWVSPHIPYIEQCPHLPQAKESNGSSQ